MDQRARIIDALIRIRERADTFRHGREELFADITLTEIHCIDWIGTIDHANVTKISNEMGMTRGAISKIGRKLLGKGLIESYQEPTNNKEIYFRLTDKGWQFYAEHRKCHVRARQEKMDLLTTYSDDEQAIILRFLNDINCQIDAALGCDRPEVPSIESTASTDSAESDA